MASVLLSAKDDQGITQRLLGELTRKKMPIEAVLAYNHAGVVRVVMDIPGKENASVAAQRLVRLPDVLSVSLLDDDLLKESMKIKLENAFRNGQGKDIMIVSENGE
jgi:hypothetical protein